MAVNRHKNKATPRKKVKHHACVLYTFSVQSKPYTNKSYADAHTILQQQYKYYNANCQSEKNYHQQLNAILSDPWTMVTARVSDFFAGAQLPSLSDWDPIMEDLNNCSLLLLQYSDIYGAAAVLNLAIQGYLSLQNQINEYAGRNLSGYDNSIAVVQDIQTTDIAVAGIVADAIVPYTGTLASTALTAGTSILQQELQTKTGVQQRVDWNGIEVDAAVGFISGEIADGISRNILSGMGLDGKTLNIKKQLVKIAVGVITSKGGDIINDALKKAVDKNKNNESFGWDDLITAARGQVSIPNSLNTAVQAAVQTAIDSYK